MRKLLELNLKLLLFARSARFRTTVGRRGGLPRQYKKLGIESVPGVRYPKVTRIQNIPNKPSIYEVVRFYGGKIYVAHYFSGPAPGVGEREMVQECSTGCGTVRWVRLSGAHKAIKHLNFSQITHRYMNQQLVYGRPQNVERVSLLSIATGSKPSGASPSGLPLVETSLLPSFGSLLMGSGGKGKGCLK